MAWPIVDGLLASKSSPNAATWRNGACSATSSSAAPARAAAAATGKSSGPVPAITTRDPNQRQPALDQGLQSADADHAWQRPAGKRQDSLLRTGREDQRAGTLAIEPATKIDNELRRARSRRRRAPPRPSSPRDARALEPWRAPPSAVMRRVAMAPDLAARPKPLIEDQHSLAALRGRDRAAQPCGAAPTTSTSTGASRAALIRRSPHASRRAPARGRRAHCAIPSTVTRHSKQVPMPQSGALRLPMRDRAGRPMTPRLSSAAASVISPAHPVRHSVDHDGDVGRHAASAMRGIARSGRNGSGSTGGVVPRIPATMRSAVPVAMVMPRPSWPAAIQTPSSAGHAPISGSLSGVAGRKPIQLRSARTSRNAGQECRRTLEHRCRAMHD